MQQELAVLAFLALPVVLAFLALIVVLLLPYLTLLLSLRVILAMLVQGTTLKELVDLESWCTMIRRIVGRLVGMELVNMASMGMVESMGLASKVTSMV